MTIHQSHRETVFRCQSVFNRRHDLTGRLCHSGTNPLIILYTFRNPATAMEKQDHRWFFPEAAPFSMSSSVGKNRRIGTL